MNNWTPGPWRVEQGTTLIWGACDAHDQTTWGMGYPVARAEVMLGAGSPFAREARYDEAEANARLIASAPDLAAENERLRKALAGLISRLRDLRAALAGKDET